MTSQNQNQPAIFERLVLNLPAFPPPPSEETQCGWFTPEVEGGGTTENKKKTSFSSARFKSHFLFVAAGSLIFDLLFSPCAQTCEYGPCAPVDGHLYDSVFFFSRDRLPPYLRGRELTPPRGEQQTSARGELPGVPGQGPRGEAAGLRRWRSSPARPAPRCGAGRSWSMALKSS